MRVIVGGMLVILASILVTSQVTTKVFSQTLPTCTDPTGKNLPCMIVISTLPAPSNTIQCQEPTGQTLPCSYATQILSNGQQVVVISVYVPPNFIFAGGPISVLKEIIIHETKTRVVHECPDDQILNHTSGKCEDKSKKCERPDSDAVTDLDKDLKTKNCDIADANEISKTPFPSPPPPICNSQISNATCPAPPVNNSTGSSNSKNIGKGGPSSEKNNVTAPIDCKTNPSDPSCPQKQNLPLIIKKCPDGSVIAASAICPTNMPTTPLTPPNPSNNNPQIAANNNPSTSSPDSENNPQSPPPNNPSSNGDKGDSSSSSSSGSSSSKYHHHS